MQIRALYSAEAFMNNENDFLEEETIMGYIEAEIDLLENALDLLELRLELNAQASSPGSCAGKYNYAPPFNGAAR